MYCGVRCVLWYLLYYHYHYYYYCYPTSCWYRNNHFYTAFVRESNDIVLTECVCVCVRATEKERESERKRVSHTYTACVRTFVRVCECVCAQGNE